MSKVFIVLICLIMLASAVSADNYIIPATTSDGVWTCPLAEGQLYEMTVYGTYSYFGPTMLADAEWSTTGGAWTEITSFYPKGYGRKNDIMDVIIDGVAVDWKGFDGKDWKQHTYSPCHSYTYSYVGKGKPIHLWIADHFPFSKGANFYHDNAGGLSLMVNPVTDQSKL